MSPANPEASAQTPHTLPIDLIAAGTHAVGDFAPADLMDGVAAIQVRHDEQHLGLGVAEDGKTYVNTENGFIPLPPGMLLEVWGPSDKGEFNAPQPHYIDGEGRLKGVLYNDNGPGEEMTPWYPSVVKERLGRIAAATSEAVHAQEVTTPVSPVHEAWVINHDTHDIVGTGADVSQPQELGTISVTGEFIPGAPDEAEPAYPRIPAEPVVARARVPLPADMHFTVGDQLRLNEMLRREDEQHVLGEVEEILNDALLQVASETAATGSGDVATLEEMMTDGTAEGGTRRLTPQQRAAATGEFVATPDETAPGRYRSNHARPEHRRENRFRRIARGIGDRILALSHRGRHSRHGQYSSTPNAVAPVGTPTTETAGRHRAQPRRNPQSERTHHE